MHRERRRSATQRRVVLSSPRTSSRLISRPTTKEQGHQTVVDHVPQGIDEGQRTDLDTDGLGPEGENGSAQGELARSRAAAVATSSATPLAASMCKSERSAREGDRPVPQAAQLRQSRRFHYQAIGSRLSIISPTDTACLHFEASIFTSRRHRTSRIIAVPIERHCKSVARHGRG
jgi:hypothetical protein